MKYIFRFMKCPIIIVVFLIFSDALFAQSVDFQGIKYGMGIAEVENILGKKLSTKPILMLSDSNEYFLDQVKNPAQRIWYLMLFKNGYLHSLNVIHEIFYHDLINCLNGRSQDTSTSSVCIKKALHGAEKGRIDLTRYTFVPYIEGNAQKMQRLFGYAVGLPLAIVLLPLFTPWIIVGDEPPQTRIEYPGNKEVLSVPKLGELVNVHQLSGVMDIQRPTGDSLRVPSYYVKGKKAAFGVEEGKVIWIYSCARNKTYGLCK